MIPKKYLEMIAMSMKSKSKRNSMIDYLIDFMSVIRRFSLYASKVCVHRIPVDSKVFELHFKNIMKYLIYGCAIFDLDFNDLIQQVVDNTINDTYEIKLKNGDDKNE